jgi:conflict system STAND superfamily ATPase
MRTGSLAATATSTGVITELRSRPLVTVVGPSGTGKSSLVRAGVIPALKRSGEGWDVHIVRPGREPLAALAAVQAYADSSPGDGGSSAAPDAGAHRAALEQLRAEPGTLGARLRAHATSKRRRIAVFVDQLEELYTLDAPPAERAAFLACLATVADDATSPLRVLLAMRSDFLDRLAEERRLGTEVTSGLVLLSPLDREGMREALLRPVEAREHRFEPPALVDRTEEAMRARDATRMAAMRALPGDPTTQLALLREIEDVRAPPPHTAREAKRRLHALATHRGNISAIARALGKARSQVQRWLHDHGLDPVRIAIPDR